MEGLVKETVVITKNKRLKFNKSVCFTLSYFGNVLGTYGNLSQTDVAIDLILYSAVSSHLVDGYIVLM